MKKLIATITALVMAASLTVATYAAPGPEGEGTTVITNATKTQNSKVEVTVPEYFEWTVPSTITLTQKDGSYNVYTGSADVTFNNILLSDGHGIKVTISGIDTIDEMTYTMTIGGEDPATGAFVDSTGSIEASATLTATHAVTAGDFDAIIFTAESVEK